MIPVAANEMAGAFEISSKRYLKVRITGNYATMGELGPFNSVRNFTQYYGSDGIMAALQFDFEGKEGYGVRSFAGLGVMKPPVNTNEPKEWGTAKEPDHLFTIASIVCGVDAKDENEMWLDLMSLGAPADWTGKLWFGMRFTHANPNRHLKVEILESTDVLPKGVTAVDPYALKGGVKPPEQPKVHALPMAKEPISLDGKLNEASWKDALVFNQFSLIGNPAVKAPETTVRMLRDSAKVYISVVMTDNHPLSGDNEKKCWRNDGVELYFQTRSNLKSTLHFIVDVVDNSYWHSVENYEDPRSPEKDLGKPEFASSRNGNVWTMELSFPISLLGDGASVTGFNFGRNRIINSTAQNYSIAHGKGYNVYSANLIQW
jgi:hypothetical protein